MSNKIEESENHFNVVNLEEESSARNSTSAESKHLKREIQIHKQSTTVLDLAESKTTCSSSLKTSTTWKCEPCNRTFTSKVKLVHHLGSVEHWELSKDHPLHTSLMVTYADMLAKLAPYKCSICATCFNDLKELVNHLVKDKEVHEKNVGLYRKLVCITCKYQCWKNEDMLKHLNSPVHERGVSGSNPVIVSATSKFYCPQCDCMCSRLQAVLAHLKWKHTKAPIYNDVDTGRRRCINRMDKTTNMKKAKMTVQKNCKETSKSTSEESEGKFSVYSEDERDDSGSDVSFRNFKGPGSKWKRNKQCGYCDAALKNKNDLEHHLEKVHQDKLLRCEPCFKTFYYPYQMTVHLKTRLHICNTKDTRDIEKGILKPTEEFPCQFCQFRTATKAGILFHELMHTSKSVDKSASAEDSEERVDENDKKKSKEKWKKPRKSHAVYNCPICQKPLTAMILRTHLYIHTGEQPFVCSICGASFSKKMTLISHELTLHREKKFTCPHCPFRSHLQMKLNDHLGTHDEGRVKNCFCLICGASFFNRSGVQVHMRIHTEEGRKFSCTFLGCHKSFISSSELENHSSVHNSESAFICKTCGYSGRTRHLLRKHEKMHLAVKPFKCEYCSYESVRGYHFQRHMRIHYQIKPYSCPHCPYTCHANNSLRKHVLSSKMHKGLNLYPCQHCSFGCNLAEEMKAHTLKEHPEIAKQFDKDDHIFAALVTGIFNVKANIELPSEPPPPYIPQAEKRNMAKKMRAKAVNCDLEDCVTITTEDQLHITAEEAENAEFEKRKARSIATSIKRVESSGNDSGVTAFSVMNCVDMNENTKENPPFQRSDLV